MPCDINCNRCNYNYMVKQLCLANSDFINLETSKLEKLVFLCSLELELQKWRKFYNLE